MLILVQRFGFTFHFVRINNILKLNQLSVTTNLSYLTNRIFYSLLYASSVKEVIEEDQSNSFYLGKTGRNFQTEYKEYNKAVSKLWVQIKLQIAQDKPQITVNLDFSTKSLAKTTVLWDWKNKTNVRRNKARTSFWTLRLLSLKTCNCLWNLL